MRAVNKDKYVYKIKGGISMAETNKNDKVGNLVRWAGDLANKHEVNALTILVQFRKLKSAGASIEQAKKDIEDIYAS